MKAVQRFKEIAGDPRFQGWPVVGEPELGAKIPFFGQTLNYRLQTGRGVEDYTSILRHFGWAVVFGVHNGRVVTLCQWKPGVNQASWELPPGGIGKIPSGIDPETLLARTQEAYFKETGLDGGSWVPLGHIMIETGKYRGAGPDDHGLAAHLFLATDLRRSKDAREPEPNEIMETLLVPLQEFREVLESGLFVEESAVACAYRALIYLGFLNWAF